MLSDDHNDWHCSICNAFERDEAEDNDLLLSCDGPCLRSFHLGCLGLAAPPPEDETWMCEDCTNREHVCFLCGDSGPVGGALLKGEGEEDGNKKRTRRACDPSARVLPGTGFLASWAGATPT